MIGDQAYEIALARTEDALRRSENRRLASHARRYRRAQGTTKPVLVDAIGHRLIALGIKLVSDHTTSPTITPLFDGSGRLVGQIVTTLARRLHASPINSLSPLSDSAHRDGWGRRASLYERRGRRRW